ncbi:KH domain-containing protein [bacterium]|nr:KH domain-containing protein [bacterium]
MTIEEYLRGLLDRMLFDNYGVEYDDDGHYIRVQISLPDAESGILIGRHGETLGHIRKLLHTIFAHEIGEKRLILYVNDYHNAREDNIRRLLLRAVRHIERSGRAYRLYGLNAAERFFAHNLIATEAKFSGYTSHSEDSNKDRVLIIERKSEA